MLSFWFKKSYKKFNRQKLKCCKVIVRNAVGGCVAARRHLERRFWNMRLNTFSSWTKRTAPFRRTLTAWRDRTTISGNKVIHSHTLATAD